MCLCRGDGFRRCVSSKQSLKVSREMTCLIGGKRRPGSIHDDTSSYSCSLSNISSHQLVVHTLSHHQLLPVRVVHYDGQRPYSMTFPPRLESVARDANVILQPRSCCDSCTAAGRPLR